ncbi:Protein YABBY 4 [Vitis vinifera]|uniref:Protein YABBY 4 n=1 Tax=Vitis vinifera TaxID=29760 RepID=A0A438C0K9_VITVI|nr:Protein YABBY 4 [Vitis vinifera]
MSSCIDVASEQLCYIPCNFCNIVLAVSIVRLSFPSSFAVKEKSYLKVSVPCSSLFDIVTVRCGHCTNLWSVNMAAAFQSLSWQDVQGDDSHPLILLPTIASAKLGFLGPLLLRKSKSFWICIHGGFQSDSLSPLLPSVTLAAAVTKTYFFAFCRVGFAATVVKASGAVLTHQGKAFLGHPTTLLQITGLTWVPLPNATPRWPWRAPASNISEERIVNRPPEKRQRVPSAYNQFIKEEIQRIKANNPDISHREPFKYCCKKLGALPPYPFRFDVRNQQSTKTGRVVSHWHEGSEKHLMSKAALRNK